MASTQGVWTDMAQRLPELLAPAGGFDAFLAAVAAGADAVYVGLDSFNARVSAVGFSEDELARACRLAHTRGVRVYVTINVFVYDDELEQAERLARRALACGADALIVADAGLICRLHERIPGAEIHLSTQAGAHSVEAVRMAADCLGVERVTTARELTVDEIGRLCVAGVPIECFVHGAICISYSGACAFSALRRGRSAMRGDCTQPCRTSYGLVDAVGTQLAVVEGDKLLCPCDYLGLRHLPQLVEAGVASLKIEGRMKNPDYVFNVVGVYRAALDAIAAGEPFDADALEHQLGRSFNRGFTDAYLRGESGAELMSFERSCNQGVRAGRVVAARRDEVDVELFIDVAAGDTLEIRFYPGKDAPADVPKRWPMVPCPANAAAGQVIPVHCKRRVGTGCEVYLTRSAGVLAQTDSALDAMHTQAEAYDGRAETACTEPDGEKRGALRPAGGEARIERVALSYSIEEAHASADSGGEVALSAWMLEDMDVAARLLPRMTLVLDEVMRPGDAGRVQGLAALSRRVVCRNMGQIEVVRRLGVPFDVGAPVFCANAGTARFYASLGAQRLWVPDELSDERVRDLARTIGADGPALVRPCAAARELMVMEHCVLTAEGPCSGACATCPRRAGERFLVDGRDGTLLPVIVDWQGRTRIFDAEATAQPCDARLA